MAKVAKEVAGFTVLPVNLPSATTSGEYVQHYIYLKPHDPQLADEDAARSLFLVNIPVTTTEADLKHLLTSQLEGGRIEHVHFSDSTAGRSVIASSKDSRNSRKRKRMTAEEIEVGLDGFSLPDVWDADIHQSGATAVVVFIDRASMEMTLKAAKRTVKLGKQIIWREGMTSAQQWSLKRYEKFNALRYPSRRELLRTVDGYMSAYAQMEEAKSKESKRKRETVDEDGFVMVTKGSRGGVKAEDAKELGEQEKLKQKEKGLEDFYRFQMREKRKEKHDEMLNKWEGDKRRMHEMRERRAKV